MNAPHTKTTVAGCLALERVSAQRHQFVDGELVAMAGESLAHSTVDANIIISLGAQLRGKACRVLSPNMKIRSGPAESQGTKGLFSYADASVVCGEPLFHDKHQDVLLNPKLIVEVLSPSTEAFDRGEKFARYAAYLESFTDYLLASTATPRLEHFSREAANRWVYTSVEGLGGALHLPNVGCRLELAEVFERVIFEA
jgi:Uma2 family endonuclease